MLSFNVFRSSFQQRCGRRQQHRTKHLDIDFARNENECVRTCSNYIYELLKVCGFLLQSTKYTYNLNSFRSS